MDRLEEIRQRHENLPPWEDDSEDVRYLLSEVDRLNARAEAAEAERDAAIEDINTCMAQLGKIHGHWPCKICVKDGRCVICKPEWRGQQAGREKNNA